MSYNFKSNSGKVAKLIFLLALLVGLTTCAAKNNLPASRFRVPANVGQSEIHALRVEPVTSLSDLAVQAAVNELSKSGRLQHGRGDYFYIPVDQQYVSRFYALLKQSESFSNCVHKPQDLGGTAHISVHANGYGKVRKEEVELLKQITKNKDLLSFSLAKVPVKKFIVHKHRHHKKQINTWYVLAVKLDFKPLAEKYSKPKEIAALKEIKKYTFHISIAVQKKSKGRCICMKSKGHCVGVD